MLYFTLLIFVHECGHFITGKILGFKLKRIEIYPYGGCSKLEYDINIPLWKEFIVLIMGPFIQVVFVLVVHYIKYDVENYFYFYHYVILVFNLLPIYPLDGGKLLNIIFAYFSSYYQSLKVVLYTSFFFYCVILFLTLLWKKNLVLTLILFLLGIKIFKEMKQADYYFQKFLLERYLNQYSFSKIKKVVDVKKMRRDYYHYFLKENGMITEKEQLTRYFS